jgi:hypothetical protein
MNGRSTLTLCTALLLAVPAWADQFVEVAADIEITSWRYQEETGLPLKKSRTYSVRCVVGTNTWLIENHSRTNFKESVWFMDGKVVRLLTLTDDPAPDEPGFGMRRRGSRSANVVASVDGYPSGDMFLNLPWFAFCSGSYLKRPERALPLPAADRAAFGFTDETTVFADSLGLPRRVAFRTTQRQLKCEYQVQKSTNVLGWNFPTTFTVVQNEPNSFGQWNRQLTVSGRVTAIRPAPKPEMPLELQERLLDWEQTPAFNKK